MTWLEFKAALAKLGLSQAEFGRLTGYSEHTISRWQHRTRGVPRWVTTWLRMLVARD